MLYDSPPDKFSPAFEAAGCYIMHDGKILVLLRAPHDGDCWCSPGGGVDAGETPEAAIVRELMEEVSIIIPLERMRHVKTYYVRKEKDFIYHVFMTSLESRPKIKLDDDHVEYRWVTPREALALNLIADEDECVKETFGI